MNTTDEVINRAIMHIKGVLEQLDCGDEVIEQEYLKIIDELEELCAMNEKSATEGQSDMNINIEEMLNKFNSVAEDSKEVLQNVLNVISAGKVPAEEDVKKLDMYIAKLQHNYNDIYSMAIKELASDEMPREGAPVTEYVEAIKNSTYNIYKKQIEEMKTVLRKFISVKSLVDKFTEALQPYQKEAEELMVELNTTRQPVEELERKIEGPQLFLGALKGTNQGFAENTKLSYAELGKYYSDTVVLGLLLGQYDLENSTSEDDINAGNTEKEESRQEGKDEFYTDETTDQSYLNVPISEDDESTKDYSEGRLEVIEEGIYTENIVAEQSDGISQDDQDEEVDTETISLFAQKIFDSGMLIDDTSVVGVLSCDISSYEDKKISASIFQNDIRKGNRKALEKIVKDIYSRQLTSKEYLENIEGMPESIATSSLEYLHKKGYLRKYELASVGEFYCASPRLMKSTTYKNAAKMLGLHQLDLESWGVPIEAKNISAACRIACDRVYIASVGEILEAEKKVSTNAFQFIDAFILKAFPSDKSADCYFGMGTFWDSTNECDEFLETVKKYLEDVSDIERIFFAGLDKEKSKYLADIMIGEIADSFNIKDIKLYSLLDNAFFSYPDCKLVDLSEPVEIDEEDSRNIHVNTPDIINDISTEEINENIEYEVVGEKKDIANKKSLESKEVVLVEKDKIIEDKISDKTPVNREDFKEKVISLINMGKFYAATAFAKAFSMDHSEYSLFYNQLAHALNDPMGHCNYSTDNAFNLIEEKGDFEDAIVISTALRTFFSNQIRYDYNIKSYYGGIKEYKLLNDYPALSKVVYSLMEFKDAYKKGVDAYADYRSKNIADLDQKMRNVQRDADMFYHNFVIGQKKENASQKRFLETKKLILSVNSEIGGYIKDIVDGKNERQPKVLEFLQNQFYKENTTIEEDTIDSNKLWDYIEFYWNEAGSLMMYQKRADLMSHLRSNIINTTTKAIQLLARWCDLVNRINDRDEDEGSIAYKKIRQPLIDNLTSAISEMKAVSADEAAETMEKAGLKVLIHTLEEIRNCLIGTYDEADKKYFYVPFLLTDDVMLDEDYLPDLKMHSSTIYSLYPTTRIWNHVLKTQSEGLSYESRLKEILDDDGDDYGAARLIVNYLMSKDTTDKFEEVALNIESGVQYAKDTAVLRKDDFIGDLELAQSYGQIDKSVEDKKEKILQIVDEWYEWAKETSNFGFFKRVMDGYLEEIREEAKARENDYLEQLASFKATTVPGLTAEAKERRIEKIQKMIKAQNYTVAEDLLARAGAFEENQEEVIDEDFLKDLLDHYEDYYQPVATRSASFASLVSSRTRNKDQRGAKRLADNWLPGGSVLGKERLETLLNCLGFKVSEAKQQSPIGKFEHYSIRTEKAKGGQRDNYTHPIAAFGSGAAEAGFRVVCINGVYDADALIEIMKKIGNAKHTLILYDNALSMSERRRLARKTKNALGDKLFAVIDRVVMMFLVRNYDETKMNKMLVSLITPFGYYQPYVWDSANVMPPEIFMGRKRELERIKSPTGVNIVYGGRQLGKSALLKKAQEDINWDENGNRAVLVDIKGLDYKKAATKVGHALYDAFVLDQDIETSDWSQLARAVSRRLRSDKDRIPYLLLLLDEADAFIDSCSTVNYQPFDALKDIQAIGTDRFKFVIAGLRNIVRFKREALGNNSVLTHLQPMTVKPFNTSEARELMEVPLYYLGLRFPKEKEYLMTLILATTNYFPGMIQMYCAKLINAMRNKDYANYDEVDTPIYEVSEEHIKKVLADPEFTQQIREKFIITLKLDEDNYYYLIALLMSFLYHNNGYNEGYSAADIKNAGIELEIEKIANLDNIKLESFMEELKELNVFRSTDEKHYLFTRFTFFQMMGTRAEVDDKLEEYMGV